MSATAADYDSPWKEALEHFFPDFLDFFFPDAYADIDWSQGHQFLDKELKQAARDAELGRRYADVLAQVWRRSGQEAWVLVHVEVQGQPQAEFAERMYVYNYRLYDWHRKQVASLAVLADEQAGWRPQQFGYELWGCRAKLDFPTVKLLDYRKQWSKLESSVNPFATVVMAHLKAQETRRDPTALQSWKLSLTRRLYKLGYDRRQVLELFGFIDWVLQLPEPQALDFWRQVQEIEEEKRMQYITSVERIGMQQGLQQGMQQGLQQGMQQGLQQGMQQGLQQGMQQGIQQGMQQGMQQGQQQGQAELLLRLLNRRFTTVSLRLAERVRRVPSDEMPGLLDIALTAATLDEVAAAVETILADSGSVVA